MASLQPLHALNLDSSQQLNFIRFFKSLPEVLPLGQTASAGACAVAGAIVTKTRERARTWTVDNVEGLYTYELHTPLPRPRLQSGPAKPATTIRIFERNEYYSVHGDDAAVAAQEVFSSLVNLKVMRVGADHLDYVVLSKGNFETFIKKLLLVKRYRVDVMVAEGSVRNNEWVVKYRASPGYLTQLEEMLQGGLGEVGEDTTLMAVNIKLHPQSKCRLVGVSCITASEYTLSVAELTDDDYLSELEAIVVQLAPSECLIPQSDAEEYKAVKKIMERAKITVTPCKKSDFSTDGLIQDLNRLVKFSEGQKRDANCFQETSKSLAMSSLAAALKYLNMLVEPTNFERFRFRDIQSDCHLHLDSAALLALNVFPTPGDTSNVPSRSLFGLLDRCRTAHGRRLLAQWLRQPLRDINLINERQDIVEALLNNMEVLQELHSDHLRRVPDLQLLCRRLSRKKAGLQDCYKIYQAVTRLPSLLVCLAKTDSSTVHSAISEQISELMDDLSRYRDMVEATIDLDAIDRGDFLVKSSFVEQLQELALELERVRRAAEQLLRCAASDLALVAGVTIKLDWNSQAGFHFRVTLKEEPALRGSKKYTIIDAIKGGVRFTSTSLDNINQEYSMAKENYEREQGLVVGEIVAIAAGYSECLCALSVVLSRLDVFVSFALTAATAPAYYCRPVLTEEADELTLVAARHPCLEVQDGISYIPNDVTFKRGECTMHIVTGANMGGKSTWMRAAGACVLLAHVGARVPASRAQVPRLRSLLARVGAEDREASGQSTFMLEMVETAAILRAATPDSLVLIDELGRGTSTYEGCGLAWAIALELATKVKCFCLFATHYHELTRLPTVAPGLVVNSHAEARVLDDRLLLLHRISPGPAQHSLGLRVARLAALPHSVLQYAEHKQASLEGALVAECAATTTDENVCQQGRELVREFLTRVRELARSMPSQPVHSGQPAQPSLQEAIAHLITKMRLADNAYVRALLPSLDILTDTDVGNSTVE